MKKLLSIVLLLTSFSIGSFGQKIGIRAGITFPTIASNSDYILEDQPNAVDYSSRTSYYAGATVDFPIAKTFNIQTGLSLIGKGADFRIDNNGVEISTKTKLYYIELPVNAIYKVPTQVGDLFFGAGPYFAYGIESKWKYKNVQSPTANQEVNISFGKDKDFKQGDFGLNFLAGFELNNSINIQAGYGLGLRNLTTKSTHYTERNRVISVGLGYIFK